MSKVDDEDYVGVDEGGRKSCLCTGLVEMCLYSLSFV